MSARYIVNESVSGFRRMKLAALGAILTTMIALLLLGFFTITAINTQRLISMFESKVEMEAFLEEPISRQRISEVEKQLLAIPGVAQVTFISKEAAAARFQEEFGEDIGSVLDFNPLPPSFKIVLAEGHRTTAQVEEIHQQVMKIKGIERDVYRKDVLSFLERQSQTLYLVGLTLGIFIAISSVFLVSNTIRLAIETRRRAIQTMKLVGASRLFIRLPFVLEGCYQGLLGGLLAAGITYYIMASAGNFLSAELAAFLQVDVKLYVGIVVMGILLGLFGSYISVRRHIGERVSS